MPQIPDTLARIDSALAAHETGGTFDDAISADAMRWATDPAAVPPEPEDPFAGAEVIHAYTRARAFADGTLVDAGPMATEAGFRYPVALTRAVWEDCVAWTDADTHRTGACQDQNGRLWDVLFMTRHAVRRDPIGDRVRVRLYRVDRYDHGDEPEPRPVELVAVCGPGDDAEPVVTLMQPHEG